MREKRSWFSVLEQMVVLLITAFVFKWAKKAALAERGMVAYGGEYLFLLIPLLYFTMKRTISDLIEDLQNYG